MKHFFLSVFALWLSLERSFAADNYTGIADARLKNWDVHLDDIPAMLRSIIDFLMGIAGTIAVIFIIVGAYKILFGSLSLDKQKGRETIIAALGGFALAALSWFIIKLILSNLS